MELRRATEALLRSHPSPLTAVFQPSKALRWQQPSCKQLLNRPLERNFTSSSRRCLRIPVIQTQAAPSSNSDSTPSTASQPRQKPANPFNETMKSLNWTSPSASKTRVQNSQLSPESERAMNGGTSATELLEQFNKMTSRDDSLDMSRMMDPFGKKGLDQNPMASVSSGLYSMPKPPRIPMKLNPSTGKTVSIGSNIDLGRGLRMLEQNCARNRIRADQSRQRFHERPGLKRKRLRRERWRRRFLDGFKATVARVKQLKKQGW